MPAKWIGSPAGRQRNWMVNAVKMKADDGVEEQRLVHEGKGLSLVPTTLARLLDADATELSLQTSDVPDLQRQVSQELTLVQRTPKLTWIGGAFVYDEHNEGQVEITVFPRQTQTRPFAKIGVKAWALFGQATYSVSSRVSLTGGARYTDEQ